MYAYIYIYIYMCVYVWERFCLYTRRKKWKQQINENSFDSFSSLARDPSAISFLSLSFSLSLSPLFSLLSVRPFYSVLYDEWSNEMKERKGKKKKKRKRARKNEGPSSTVKILMFYFFLFYRLSQSTKLHPRVLITSIAKTQRGKFSRVSSLLACTPRVVHVHNGDIGWLSPPAFPSGLPRSSHLVLHLLLSSVVKKRKSTLPQIVRTTDDQRISLKVSFFLCKLLQIDSFFFLLFAFSLSLLASFLLPTSTLFTFSFSLFSFVSVTLACLACTLLLLRLTCWNVLLLFVYFLRFSSSFPLFFPSYLSGAINPLRRGVAHFAVFLAKTIFRVETCKMRDKFYQFLLSDNTFTNERSLSFVVLQNYSENWRRHDKILRGRGSVPIGGQSFAS